MAFAVAHESGIGTGLASSAPQQPRQLSGGTTDPHVNATTSLPIAFMGPESRAVSSWLRRTRLRHQGARGWATASREEGGHASANCLLAAEGLRSQRWAWLDQSDALVRDCHPALALQPLEDTVDESRIRVTSFVHQLSREPEHGEK